MITPNTDTLFITNAIRDQVAREVAADFEALKNKMIEDLDRRKDEICSGVVLNVMKYVQMQTINENLVITIKKIENKSI